MNNLDGEKPETKGQPGLAAAAFFALCPRCGAKGLFQGLTAFAPRCPACGLDYQGFNVGDGPAAFLTMVIGGLILALGLWIEFTLEPPLWLLLALLTPLVLGATLWGLRVSKAALLAAEFQRKAVEATGKDLRNVPASGSGTADD